MTRVLALLIAAFVAQAVAPPRDPRRTAGPPTASISGRVVDDRGEPVPAAIVVAAGGPAVPGARSAITTEDGRYTMHDVAPGLYTLSAGKAGFPTARAGQTRPGGPGKPFELAAGQQMTVPLMLPRGAVIAGTAVDEHGNPARSFAIMRESGGTFVRVLYDYGLGVDALGRFRVYGLAPGTYRFLPLADGMSSSAAEPSDSTSITVGPGDERDGVVVRLPGPRPKTYVTVSVSATDGHSLRSFQLSVRGPGQTRGGYMPSRPNPNGSRTLTGISEGKYRIVARDGAYWGSADVAVDGEHPTTVAIAMSAGIRVTGTANIDGAPPPRARAASVVLGAADADGLLEENNSISAPVNQDGSFTLNGVPPGRYVISSYGDWPIGSVTLGGTDVTDLPVTIGRENVDGLSVRFARTAAMLRGVVSGADGGPANGVDVVAFPADEKYRVLNSRRVATSRTNVTGEYEIRGLPPGVYALAVVDEIQPATLRDPASVARLRAIAGATLGAGETRTVNLTVR